MKLNALEALNRPIGQKFTVKDKLNKEVDIVEVINDNGRKRLKSINTHDKYTLDDFICSCTFIPEVFPVPFYKSFISGEDIALVHPQFKQTNVLMPVQTMLAKLAQDDYYQKYLTEGQWYIAECPEKEDI